MRNFITISSDAHILGFRRPIDEHRNDKNVIIAVMSSRKKRRPVSLYGCRN